MSPAVWALEPLEEVDRFRTTIIPSAQLWADARFLCANRPPRPRLGRHPERVAFAYETAFVRGNEGVWRILESHHRDSVPDYR